MPGYLCFQEDACVTSIYTPHTRNEVSDDTKVAGACDEEKRNKRTSSAMRLFIVLSRTPYYIRYAVKSSLCLSCRSAICNAASRSQGEVIILVQGKRYQNSLMRNAPPIYPAIRTHRLYLEVSKGAHLDTDNACGQAYRKKIIMTPNIFASNHLFEDTLPQYFKSSR